VPSQTNLPLLQDPTECGAPRDTDVLIIGGGPAGSTAAILLREKGHQVTLLEKERHPRFHIGESLLPANLELFERLGVAEQIRAVGMPKWGAEFISPWHGRGETFEFSESWDHTHSYAYQVRRSEFDEILIRRAAAVGAQVLESCCVTAVDFRASADGGGAVVHARNEDGTELCWRARYVLDASGRDTFLASRLGTKQRNRRHNSAALYGHYDGAERYEGKRAGNISLYWFDHGWFWFIPLADGATSVGAVVWPYYLKRRSGDLKSFLTETIALCPPLAERLKNATLVTDVEATGNYSYTSARSYGDCYLLLGDAYAFIDPVFSSGVWLAMRSAEAGTEAVETCLRHPDQAAAALKKFDRTIRHGPRVFSWFIYRITTPAMRDMFMHPRNVMRVKEALLSVLAGDIYGNAPIWTSLRLFKGLYYTFSLLNLPRSLRAARQRRRNIKAEPRKLPVHSQ
jgi:flavin-dependent dehydrogenase